MYALDSSTGRTIWSKRLAEGNVEVQNVFDLSEESADTLRVVLVAMRTSIDVRCLCPFILRSAELTRLTGHERHPYLRLRSSHRRHRRYPERREALRGKIALSACLCCR